MQLAAAVCPITEAWDAVGEMFSVTGHVAVVVNVAPTFVDVVEQNVLDEVWDNASYSRRLPAALVSNSFTVSCTFEGSRILGWVKIRGKSSSSFQVKAVESNAIFNMVLLE